MHIRGFIWGWGLEAHDGCWKSMIEIGYVMGSWAYDGDGGAWWGLEAPDWGCRCIMRGWEAIMGVGWMIEVGSPWWRWRCMIGVGNHLIGDVGAWWGVGSLWWGVTVHEEVSCMQRKYHRHQPTASFRESCFVHILYLPANKDQFEEKGSTVFRAMAHKHTHTLAYITCLTSIDIYYIYNVRMLTNI